MDPGRVAVHHRDVERPGPEVEDQHGLGVVRRGCARIAAVGSLITVTATSPPNARAPASIVWARGRCGKCAGTAIATRATRSPGASRARTAAAAVWSSTVERSSAVRRCSLPWCTAQYRGASVSPGSGGSSLNGQCRASRQSSRSP